jgi:hypothetical protein
MAPASKPGGAAAPPAASLTGSTLSIGAHPLLTGVPPSVTATPGPLPGSLVLGLNLDGPTAQADVVLGKLGVTR